jgi:hypothetical protein
VLIFSVEAAPRVVVEVPPDFHQVPLEQQTEARTASQLQVLDEMGLTESDQREALSLYLEGLAVRLTTASLGGSAFCAVQLDGRPSTATLTMALQPTRTIDRGLAVLGAAESMRRAARYPSVAVVQLGGQAVVTAVTERSLSQGSGAVPGAVLREMLAFVPVPGHEFAALLTLATPCLDDWDVYADVLLDICRSVQVERPEPSLLG